MLSNADSDCPSNIASSLIHHHTNHVSKSRAFNCLRNISHLCFYDCFHIHTTFMYICLQCIWQGLAWPSVSIRTSCGRRNMCLFSEIMLKHFVCCYIHYTTLHITWCMSYEDDVICWICLKFNEYNIKIKRTINHGTVEFEELLNEHTILFLDYPPLIYSNLCKAGNLTLQIVICHEWISCSVVILIYRFTFQ